MRPPASTLGTRSDTSAFSAANREASLAPRKATNAVAPVLVLPMCAKSDFTDFKMFAVWSNMPLYFASSLILLVSSFEITLMDAAAGPRMASVKYKLFLSGTAWM